MYYDSTNAQWNVDDTFGHSGGSGAPSVYAADLTSASARWEYNVVNLASIGACMHAETGPLNYVRFESAKNRGDFTGGQA